MSAWPSTIATTISRAVPAWSSAFANALALADAVPARHGTSPSTITHTVSA